MKDMISQQTEYNKYAPILMTSVDFDPDLCREERNDLFRECPELAISFLPLFHV